jgi:hypothetical protein
LQQFPEILPGAGVLKNILLTEDIPIENVASLSTEKQYVFETLKRLLNRLFWIAAQKRPTLVVIEDLHFFDSGANAAADNANLDSKFCPC